MTAFSTALPKLYRRQSGFGIVTAIFLIVVLAGLGAAILVVVGLQHASSAMDVQGARAYQAARAGMDWGVFQVMDPHNTLTPAASALPACFASTVVSSSLAGFTTTVTCTSTQTTELDRNVNVYEITSTAKAGTPGTAGYIERQLTVTISRCKDPSGTAPRFACP